MTQDPAPIGWHGYPVHDRPYQMCSHCVMDTSNPAIVFDENGRCQFCKWVENHLLNHIWFPEGGEPQLNRIIERVRAEGAGKEYDLLIGLSGGVDSSYLAYLTVRKWKLRPLCLHIDTGWNSEIAVGNIERLVKTLDVDLYTEVVDWEAMQDLQRAFLLSGVYQQDIPQDNAITALQYTTARKFGIKTLFGGWNPSSESVPGPIELRGHTLTDSRYIRAIHRAHGRKPLAKYQLLSFFDNYVYYPYIYGLRLYYPYRFMRFDTRKVRAELEVEVGWRSYGDKHTESRWTRYYQGYYLSHYYHVDKRRIHLSSEIMNGTMTRAEALAVLETPPYDPKLVALEEDFIMKKLELGENEYRDALARAPVSMKAYPNEAKLWLAMDRLKRLIGIRVRG